MQTESATPAGKATRPRRKASAPVKKKQPAKHKFTAMVPVTQFEQFRMLAALHNRSMNREFIAMIEQHVAHSLTGQTRGAL